MKKEDIERLNSKIPKGDRCYSPLDGSAKVNSCPYFSRKTAVVNEDRCIAVDAYCLLLEDHLPTNRKECDPSAPIYGRDAKLLRAEGWRLRAD